MTPKTVVATQLTISSEGEQALVTTSENFESVLSPYTNPIQEDAELQRLLQQLYTVNSKEDYHKVRDSIVGRLVTFLSEAGMQEAEKAYRDLNGIVYDVLSQLQSLQNGENNNQDNVKITGSRKARRSSMSFFRTGQKGGDENSNQSNVKVKVTGSRNRRASMSFFKKDQNGSDENNDQSKDVKITVSKKGRRSSIGFFTKDQNVSKVSGQKKSRRLSMENIRKKFHRGSVGIVNPSNSADEERQCSLLSKLLHCIAQLTTKLANIWPEIVRSTTGQCGATKLHFAALFLRDEFVLYKNLIAIQYGLAGAVDEQNAAFAKVMERYDYCKDRYNNEFSAFCLVLEQLGMMQAAHASRDFATDRLGSSRGQLPSSSPTALGNDNSHSSYSNLTPSDLGSLPTKEEGMSIMDVLSLALPDTVDDVASSSSKRPKKHTRSSRGKDKKAPLKRNSKKSTKKASKKNNNSLDKESEDTSRGSQDHEVPMSIYKTKSEEASVLSEDPFVNEIASIKSEVGFLRDRLQRLEADKSKLKNENRRLEEGMKQLEENKKPEEAKI